MCVVIPAYNEELLIGRCIQSVLDAGVPPQNVYVVNDRSTDHTAETAAAFENVNVLTNQKQLGKLGGLLRAITDAGLAARYDYLALLDADSHVDGNYFLAVIEQFLGDQETVLVCGAPKSERHNWLTAYRALEYAVTLRAYRAGQHKLGVINVAPGCASTYRTNILAKLDWTGGTLVEDMELTVQIHRRSLGSIGYAPDAVAYTQDPRTIREYFGQLTGGTAAHGRSCACTRFRSGGNASTRNSRCWSPKAASTRPSHFCCRFFCGCGRLQSCGCCYSISCCGSAWPSSAPSGSGAPTF
jgi:cellulose synthase/poly-beta-1,6-N-acetylglucosamine synthase-like glycosyltransferase